MKIIKINKMPILLLLLLAIFGCGSNSSTAVPDLTTTVMGNYKLSYLNLAGTEITPDFLMLVGGNSVIQLSKKDTKNIILYLKTVIRGTTTEVNKEFSLVDAGNNVINILENGILIGTYQNGKIDIKTTYDKGILSLIANKI